jgi:tRNA (mo5U34)-methyltransferase
MDISDVLAGVDEPRQRIARARAEIGDGIAWYPYDILGNLVHLERVLTGGHRDLARLADGRPVADIGAADGDLAFVLEDLLGWTFDIVDNPPTNYNGLRAARALVQHLGSRAQVHAVDLDTQFRLPREGYGLVFLLGILYHLQNPYFALRRLSEVSDHLLISTRVARFAGPDETPIGALPVAYLVGPQETNADPTNYWMFSPRGLRQIVVRAGWRILDEGSVGATDRSDPSSPDRDERMFMLLRSRRDG